MGENGHIFVREYHIHIPIVHVLFGTSIGSCSSPSSSDGWPRMATLIVLLLMSTTKSLDLMLTGMSKATLNSASVCDQR
jgi:hypothetical protein